jgi:heat shock protein HslJ
METEKAFLAELRNVAKWKIKGTHLELLDAGGTLVAQFDGGPTK